MTQAIFNGGVPMMLRVARESSLIDEIDRGVPIFKWRCPYYEPDHVLNLAVNTLERTWNYAAHSSITSTPVPRTEGQSLKQPSSFKPPADIRGNARRARK